MDYFFVDPELKRFPPEKTRLLDLRAEPYADRHRIRVGPERYEIPDAVVLGG